MLFGRSNFPLPLSPLPPLLPSSPPSRPVILVGGATSKIGDPTGKDASRKMLTDGEIAGNVAGISSVFNKFIDFSPTLTCPDPSNPTAALLLDNNTWLSSFNYLAFLRDYGTHFTINRMLAFDSVKTRMERDNPLTFLEFNYMILQAVDFLHLAEQHGVELQLGGSDQWGNMVSGVELARRKGGKRVFALTAPLIQTSDGKKMGKTEGGAVWLNVEQLPAFGYWQFWRNTSDDDVVRFLKLFTELPLEEIEKLAALKGSGLNDAKKVLADEATGLLHGRECLDEIHRTAESLFAGAQLDTSSLPQASGPAGTRLIDFLCDLKFAASKKEAKRLIAAGGCRIDDVVVTDELLVLGEEYRGKEAVVRAGKKRAGVVRVE